jgi:hypothetical protein
MIKRNSSIHLVVVLILIISLVILSFYFSDFKKSDFTPEILGTNLKLSNIVFNESNVSFQVNRESGEKDIYGLRVILEDRKGNVESRDVFIPIKTLESKNIKVKKLLNCEIKNFVVEPTATRNLF